MLGLRGGVFGSFQGVVSEASVASAGSAKVEAREGAEGQNINDLGSHSQ